MSIRVLKSIIELDGKLAEADIAAKVSPVAFRAALDGFVLDPGAMLGDLPSDPDSEDYRVAQLRLYEKISGRSYLVENEDTPFDHAHMMRWPFPYSSKSPTVVPEYLMTYGNLIKTMNLPNHARVLEIGSGYGPLTWQLASMGHSVTCVDMSEKLLNYVKQRTSGLPGQVSTVKGDMNDLELVDSFDAIIFFESFHHCSNPLGLLRRLPKLLEPEGMVVFAGEPIVAKGCPAVPYPWGLRLDGLSLWFIRKLGWLELGYQEPYLLGLLERLGWNVVRKPSALSATMGIWMAKRKIEDSPAALPKSGTPAQTWAAASPALRSQFKQDEVVGAGIQSRGQIGYLLFGPYASLDSGFYEVQWHGSAEPRSRMHADVACESGARVLRAADIEVASRLPQGSTSMIARLRFKVDTPVADIEFRIRLDAAAEVSISRVELYAC